MVGIDICLLDDQGDFVIVKTYCFSPLCEVDVREDVSLHTAFQWLVALHYDNVDFALDSKTVVDCVNSNLEHSSDLGCIIHACRQLFACNFQNSHVEFNRRQANEVSHELA
jgi:ribonuclease HI